MVNTVTLYDNVISIVPLTTVLLSAKYVYIIHSMCPFYVLQFFKSLPILTCVTPANILIFHL